MIQTTRQKCTVKEGAASASDVSISPLTDYVTTWDMMKELVESKTRHKREVRLAESEGRPTAEINPPASDHIILVQHTPTYTIGRNFRWERDSHNFKNTAVSNYDDSGSDDFDSDPPTHHNNIPIHKVERGGDVTYHGPGQLTAYFIVDLESPNHNKDLKRFVENLEEVVTIALKNVCARHGACEKVIQSIGRDDRNHGCWVGVKGRLMRKKIAAVGISCTRWVTMHGVSINLDMMSNERSEVGFGGIKACGIEEVNEVEALEGVVTCLREVLGDDVNNLTIEEVGEELVRGYEEVFEVEAIASRRLA